MNRQNAIINSALWAAYGDALGFISELTDEAGLNRRLGGKPFNATRPWRRKIGGPYGAIMDLPAGCYSDDTQLRLATMRSIRGSGEFDVETFAKIELPVWLAYDLGAGPTTKAAAASLGNRNSNWFSNFFARGNLLYVNGGGNGAAMRVQPHVWASRSLRSPERFLSDVVRNTICSHGHPRGIFGSVFHALCLAHVLEHRELPPRDSWLKLANTLGTVEHLVMADRDLSTFWRPTWDKESKRSFGQVCKETLSEIIRDIDVVLDVSNMPGGAGYGASVKALDAFSDRWRGTGTKTAVLALTLAWSFKNKSVKEAMLHGAGLLNSDTDTIATLTGALLGALSEEAPVDEIMDRDYIRKEAFRLAKIADGQPTESFTYPDILTWKHPKSSLDAIGLVSGVPALAGLGYLKLSGDVRKGNSKESNVWEWAKLDFGQSVLVKRRSRLEPLPPGNVPAQQSSQATTIKQPEDLRELTHRTQPPSGRPEPMRELMHKFRPYPERAVEQKPDLFENRAEPARRSREDQNDMTLLDRLTDDAIKSGFDPVLMGKHLRRLVETESGIQLATGYAAIVAKAWSARKRRNTP